MPEYLAPGVYVEETSFRSKSIEGVSTSIAGMIGPARFGPIGGEPELLTSFTEYERMFGGIDQLRFRSDPTSTTPPPPSEVPDEERNYLAFAARAFFDNGGTKLYVTRVYATAPNAPDTYGFAGFDATAGGVTMELRARFPGHAGNMRVEFQAIVGGNILSSYTDNAGNVVNTVTGLANREVVFIGRPPALPVAAAVDTITTGATDYGLYTVVRDPVTNAVEFQGVAGNIQLANLDPQNDAVLSVTVQVEVQSNGRFDDPQRFGEFVFHPRERDSLTAHFHSNPESKRLRLSLPLVISWAGQQPDPRDYSGAPEPHEIAAALLPNLSAAIQLEYEFQVRRENANATNPAPAPLAARRIRETARVGRLSTFHLADGHDGVPPAAIDYEGEEDGNNKTGLKTLEDVEDISIISAPAYASLYEDDPAQAEAIQQLLISHAERMRYRIAVLDSGQDFTLSEVRDQRNAIDSKYAALYYPWIRVVDPLAQRGTPAASQEILLPPSGFVSGIFARNDVEKGVSKTPANEVVRGAIGFEFTLNKAQQDVLNPEGVNAFRFFEGRGYRLWGGRTVSSDPEWKYVGVRRYFAYLERSIEKGTQWVVFENNNERLWANVKRTIEDFLFNEWNNGSLMGAKPEEAYWVRCDRTTMTQNDIDNGRLVCLIGVSPNRPAEFVIFRIGQWTGDRKQ